MSGASWCSSLSATPPPPNILRPCPLLRARRVQDSAAAKDYHRAVKTRCNGAGAAGAPGFSSSSSGNGTGGAAKKNVRGGQATAAAPSRPSHRPGGSMEETRLRRALAGSRESLGERHAGTAAHAARLAEHLRKVGTESALSESVELLRGAVRTCRVTRGESAEETLMAMALLGNTLADFATLLSAESRDLMEDLLHRAEAMQERANLDGLAGMVVEAEAAAKRAREQEALAESAFERLAALEEGADEIAAPPAAVAAPPPSPADKKAKKRGGGAHAASQHSSPSPPIPESDLERLPRAELQALAKEYGLKGSLRSVELAAALARLRDESRDAQPLMSSRRVGAGDAVEEGDGDDSDEEAAAAMREEAAEADLARRARKEVEAAAWEHDQAQEGTRQGAREAQEAASMPWRGVDAASAFERCQEELKSMRHETSRRMAAHQPESRPQQQQHQYSSTTTSSRDGGDAAASKNPDVTVGEHEQEDDILVVRVEGGIELD